MNVEMHHYSTYRSNIPNEFDSFITHSPAFEQQNSVLERTCTLYMFTVLYNLGYSREIVKGSLL